MSSNSYILIKEKRNGHGGFKFEVSVRDIENYKSITDKSDFDTLREAVEEANDLINWYWESGIPIEYGLQIDLYGGQDEGNAKREANNRRRKLSTD